MAVETHFPLFEKAIHHYLRDKQNIRILEVGSGDGSLVKAFVDAGYDAFGCDIVEGRFSRYMKDSSRVLPIQIRPYKLPFGDNYFDVVLSANVLEHVNNKEETALEIRRVLKNGGLTINAFPSKWYIPLEPHIKVPFVSWMWPNVPELWIKIWAHLGIRNEYQTDMSAKEVFMDNKRFCTEAINYISREKYRKIFQDIFTEIDFPAHLYARWHNGKAGFVMRALPDWLKPMMLLFREDFLVARKMPNVREDGSVPS
ncbi:class I SAM-dependent methyltransferase [Methylobacterium sp. JK268]